MTAIAGRFEVESVAGAGGMGTVYRARDLASATRERVALKLVRGRFANARFEREAMLLSQIEGPGIVRYVAHGRVDADSMFLAMQWLEGEGLDRRLERGALAPGDCIAIGRRVARALAIAHARGVVHRDVKPSNVILQGGDAARATLVDFGIARARHEQRGLTATGTVLGTPQYMAPEQARGDRGVDARADVFSLGCLLFECLTGRAAFVGAHMIAVLAKILLEPADRVSALRDDVPAALDDLVAAMLEKAPEARPPDGEAVAAALDAIHDGDAPTAPGAAPPAIGNTERRLATVVLARAGTTAAATRSWMATRSCAA
jgi:serine/threonine protein kinase